MLAYETSTRPLTAYYEQTGRLVSVQALGTPEETLERALSALNDRLAARPA